jgi:hypothetical protein
MAVLTWRNVDAPDLSRSIEGMSRITQGVQSSFDRLGGFFQNQHDQAIRDGTNEALAKVLLAKDAAALDAMRGGLVEGHPWNVNQAVVAEGFNRQYGDLQDRGIKAEQILDNEAWRTDAGKITAGLMNTQRTGADLDPALLNSRIFGKFANEYLQAGNTFHDDQFQEKEFTERQRQSAIDNGFQAANLAESKLSRAEARAARQQELDFRYGPSRAYVVGQNGSDTLSGADALLTQTGSPAKALRAAQEQSKKLPPEMREGYLKGVTDRLGLISSDDAAFDRNPNVRKAFEGIDAVVNNATSQATANKEGLGGMDDRYFTAQRAAKNGNLTISEALAKSPYGKDEAFVAETREYMDRYLKKGLSPAMIVDIAEQNRGKGLGTTTSGWGRLNPLNLGGLRGQLSEGEMKPALDAMVDWVHNTDAVRSKAMASLPKFDQEANRIATEGASIRNRIKIEEANGGATAQTKARLMDFIGQYVQPQLEGLSESDKAQKLQEYMVDFRKDTKRSSGYRE